MEASIGTAILGIICILLGISNRKGHINSLHSYHRKRVSEEDRIPFGKLIGLGTILIGIGLLAYAAFSCLDVLLEKQILTWIGTGFLIAGLVVGLGFSFYAMIKYNKGIF